MTRVRPASALSGVPSPNFAAARSRFVLAPIAAIAVLSIVFVAAAGDSAAERALIGHHPGGDPRGDSWTVMRQSFEQFTHPTLLIRLFLGLALAVGCAWLVAWHPRRSTRLDPLSDLEERKTLIVLGMVGAVIAELSGVSESLAFVIFGIGALLRFRTLLDNPKLTGKAITVVIIGLACGLGQWAMAVFVTLFAWGLLYWLDSHMSCRVRIRMPAKTDLPTAYGQAQEVLVAKHCRLKNSSLDLDRRQMVFLAHVPTQLDPAALESDLRTTITRGDAAEIDVRVE